MAVTLGQREKLGCLVADTLGRGEQRSHRTVAKKREDSQSAGTMNESNPHGFRWALYYLDPVRKWNFVFTKRVAEAGRVLPDDSVIVARYALLRPLLFSIFILILLTILRLHRLPCFAIS